MVSSISGGPGKNPIVPHHDWVSGTVLPVRHCYDLDFLILPTRSLIYKDWTFLAHNMPIIYLLNSLWQFR